MSKCIQCEEEYMVVPRMHGHIRAWICFSCMICKEDDILYVLKKESSGWKSAAISDKEFVDIYDASAIATLNKMYQTYIDDLFEEEVIDVLEQR